MASSPALKIDLYNFYWCPQLTAKVLMGINKLRLVASVFQPAPATHKIKELAEFRLAFFVL